MHTQLVTRTEEFLAWIDGQEEKYELLEGVPEMTPPPRTSHQSSELELASMILSFLRGVDLGNVFTGIGYWVDDQNYLIPDISFYCAEKLRNVPPEQFEEGFRDISPDLVVEVISPAYRKKDFVTKKTIYEAHGIKEYWIVDPREKKFVFLRHDGQHYQEIIPTAGIFHDSMVLPGFEVDMNVFWHRVFRFAPGHGE